jgi:bifunctional UDP-N-acetylglucosamine pyrophosphorylase/glucosamine-1-phosphate N-acetyltransferase
MLEHLILAAKRAGIKKFICVVGYGEREVRNYFSNGSRWDVSISYTPQRHQLGTADALNAARDHVSGKFLVMNGDMIVTTDDIHAVTEKDPPCMGVYRTDHPEQYGVVTTDNGHVTSLIEKSAASKDDTINAGIYLFEPDIFDMLDRISLSSRGEYELTDALTYFIREKRLSAHVLREWMDVGNPWDLLDANARLMECIEPCRSGILEEGVVLSGLVSVGEGTVVKSGSYIEGPCIIGRNCRIGPHAYIRGSTAIGDECHIGHATEIKNSIIMYGTKIPHFNYVGDSVVGSNCNFGAGTKVANLRHDHGTVRVCGKDTHRKKFGAVIGDNVQFGINCSVNTGTVIGTNVQCAPHTYIEGCIQEKTIIR